MNFVYQFVYQEVVPPNFFATYQSKKIKIYHPEDKYKAKEDQRLLMEIEYKAKIFKEGLQILNIDTIYRLRDKQ